MNAKTVVRSQPMVRKKKRPPAQSLHREKIEQWIGKIDIHSQELWFIPWPNSIINRV
jgi:hypothetical protein